jgi:hypothetical protein
LSFTVVVEPGFRYEVETSEDLLTWESLGNILAEGNTIEFTDSVDRTRLFYRFRRTP